jgi:hypothetical protein
MVELFKDSDSLSVKLEKLFYPERFNKFGNRIRQSSIYEE